jgi:hypothetical protein
MGEKKHLNNFLNLPGAYQCVHRVLNKQSQQNKVRDAGALFLPPRDKAFGYQLH